MIGLSYKAGKVKYGSDGVADAIRSCKKPSLVLLAADASANQVKKITDRCRYYNVRLISISADKSELGKMIKGRSELACVAIEDEGFAKAMIDLINKNESELKAESAGGAQ